MTPQNKTLKNKPNIPKMTTQTLLDFDLGESSSDSDFRIEDHADETDDDFSDNSNGTDEELESDDENQSDDSDNSEALPLNSSIIFSPKSKGNSNIEEIVSKIKLDENAVARTKIELSKTLICCACLGDRSDDANEIVECDGCGVAVHEGCYGISDTVSISSTNSSCSTEPWFCEACKAGKTEPNCELCPEKGGIFKETEVGRWVHLICALYVPGVAFGEVDHLSSVTLFEMQYSKWGAKQCSLCEDEKYARTGVCIGCDAGMCKTFFHVTCAQAAGLLSEPHSDEADHADPFYAHCKIHSDKNMIKHRKRNFHLMKMKLLEIKSNKEQTSDKNHNMEQMRIQKKLAKHQNKYKLHKETKNEPWVPTQKIPRLLTTSARVIRRLHEKANVMGIDTDLLEFQEAQVASITDIRKKWHIAPSFSVEFVAYYLDRMKRLKELKNCLEINVNQNDKLLTQQTYYREDYDKKIRLHSSLLETNTKLRANIDEMNKNINAISSNKQLKSVDIICQQHETQISVAKNLSMPSVNQRTITVPTAAARKMGVGFPLNNLPGNKLGEEKKILSTQIQSKNQLVQNCGICKKCNDQHLLAKCDTCHLHYHLGCLNPPLSRHPKKTKLYGWQCSECDKSDEYESTFELPSGPRRSRTKFSKDGKIIPVDNISGKQSVNSNKISTSAGETFLNNTNKRFSQNSNGEKSCNNSSEETTNTDLAMLNGQVKHFKTKTKTKEKKTIFSNAISSNLSDKNISLSNEEGLEYQVKSPREQSNNFIKKSLSLTQKTFCKEEQRLSSESTEPTAIFESVNSADKSPLAENIIKANRSLKRKKDEEVDPLQISPRKLNSIPTLKSITQTDETVLSEANQKNSFVINDSFIDFSIDNSNITYKQNRKKRKEKHKNKTYSDSDKSPSKEHKRKRKKKSHDINFSKDLSMSSVPKIKIKFKQLPLPGEIAPEPQFFYVSADMVRATDASSRPTSVETVEDTVMSLDNENISKKDTSTSKALNASCFTYEESSPSKRTHKPINKDMPKYSDILKKMSTASPRRNKPSRMSTNSTTSSNNLSASSQLLTSTSNLKCFVCQLLGSIENSVQCDECYKIYHFTCLDPPVKKTPKRRGYSWHCAECDPTDHEGT